MNCMANKRLFLPVIVFTFSFLAIGITLDYRRVKKKYETAKHIKFEDSLFLKLKKYYWYRKGGFIFKNKYLLSKYNHVYDTVIKINFMKLPLNVHKRKNNDTIWFINKKETHYLVLDEPKVDTVQHIGDMSILEFYRKYIKKTKKK